MASGLPTLPPAGRAAHHGVPCVACDAAEERLACDAAACAAGDAGTEFACARASASSPPIPAAAPAPMAAAPAPSFMNFRRPILESLPESFMISSPERCHPEGRSPRDLLLLFGPLLEYCRPYTTPTSRHCTSLSF